MSKGAGKTHKYVNNPPSIFEKTFVDTSRKHWPEGEEQEKQRQLQSVLHYTLTKKDNFTLFVRTLSQ